MPCLDTFGAAKTVRLPLLTCLLPAYIPRVFVYKSNILLFAQVYIENYISMKLFFLALLTFIYVPTFIFLYFAKKICPMKFFVCGHSLTHLKYSLYNFMHIVQKILRFAQIIKIFVLVFPIFSLQCIP